MKKVTKIFVIIISIIALILVGKGIYAFVQEKAEYKKEAVPMDLYQIYLDYESNELVATEKYDGNRYRITAEIYDFGNDVNGNHISIKDESNHMFGFYFIMLEEKDLEYIKNFSKGETITFEGTFEDHGSGINRFNYPVFIAE